MSLIINCFIVEDEPIAQDTLTTYIEWTPGLVLKGCSANAATLCRQITDTKPDLIFLDMHLPGITGFELLHQLKQQSQSMPYIIITTAFEEYALKGYEHSVLDYLVKTFEYERFLKGIDQVKRVMEPIYLLQQEQIKSSIAELIVTNLPVEPPSMLSVRVERGIQRIPIQSIAYIEAMDNYVKIYQDSPPATGRKFILSKVTLTNFQKSLPNNKFIRVSRSILVPIEKIKQMKENFIHLYDGSKLTIGGTYKETVRHYFT